ncbi:MAG: PIG-L deacetylase family protein [Planctomycetota bacterium]|jgi:LmbE family N-acetylglucosaminyl deacetylase
MKVLAIAPHPDDEVLGAGGTIARLASEGNEVTVVIVTKGWLPLFADAQVEKVRAEARAANETLGVKSLRFMDLPVTKLNQIPKHKLNRKFEQLIDEELPELVFLPFFSDLQEDHRQVFDACMVALRPLLSRKHVKQILCYETVSETHWSAANIEPYFQPQVWVDISNHLSAKMEAMRKYNSQLQPEPNARSLEAISSLAKWRGSMVGMHAAECFVVVRELWRAL